MSIGDATHPHRVSVLPDLSEPTDELARELACHACGLRLLGLVLWSPMWVTRRVESVSFRDHRTVRRRVSVDFSIPRSAPPYVIDGSPYRLLPLTLMRRKSLVNFDLRDEGDASVTLLGLRHNQAITLALSEALAGSVLDTAPTELPGDVQKFLKDVVRGTQDELVDAWNRARGPAVPPDVRRLQADGRFSHVMRRVADDFLLLSLVPDEGPARRVYKFRYDEPMSRQYRVSGVEVARHKTFTPRVSLWSREPILAALGWTPTRIRFPTPAAENAASYHFEIHAPPGVAIESAKILAGRRNPELATADPSVDQVTGGLPTVDLHVIDVERGSVSRAQVDLRLAADSWLVLAFSCAWLTAAALFWAANRLGEEGDRENAAASALFITFTVALAAILVAAPRASDGDATPLHGRSHRLHVVPAPPDRGRAVRVRAGQASLRAPRASRCGRHRDGDPPHGDTHPGVPCSEGEALPVTLGAGPGCRRRDRLGRWCRALR